MTIAVHRVQSMRQEARGVAGRYRAVTPQLIERAIVFRPVPLGRVERSGHRRVGAGFSLLLTGMMGLCACERTPFREVPVSFAQPRPNAPTGAATLRDGATLRVSVAGMESPTGTYAAYSQLFGDVAGRLDAGVDFVQRRTYAEVNELLLKGELDAALLCTGGYLELVRREPKAVEIVGVPVVDGADTYQSLIIVPAASDARSLDELAGGRFAFTDELSLTGRAWVVHELRTKGMKPESFFKEITFTRSHDRSVAAVAKGLVDGAAVHSVVFQHLLEKDPGLTERVRVIQRSPGFGMTPVVVSTRLPPERREALKRVLLGLADDTAGRALLAPLHINRFESPGVGLFDSAIEVVQGPR